MASTASLRDQLVGAWELIKYYAYLPEDHSDLFYPMGPQATGIIMYTPDGYMSAQLHNPTHSTHPSLSSTGQSTEYIAYTGAFSLSAAGDAKGPLLYHQMRYSNLPGLRGDVQRRLMEIAEEGDGTYLTLAPEGPLKMGEQGKERERVLVVRWKRLRGNEEGKEAKKVTGGKL